jgi:hypothetical protein
MPQSFALIIVHLVFSTKDRAPVLNPSIRTTLHAYLATVARNAGCVRECRDASEEIALIFKRAE